MPYYEVIFETGDHSIAFAESEEEMRQGLEVHHERAKAGMQGGPAGHRAERVKRVLEYDRHPADYGVTMTHDAATVSKALNESISKVTDPDGKVHVPALNPELSQLTSPVALRSGPHDSSYKAKEVRELDWED